MFYNSYKFLICKILSLFQIWDFAVTFALFLFNAFLKIFLLWVSALALPNSEGRIRKFENANPGTQNWGPCPALTISVISPACSTNQQVALYISLQFGAPFIEIVRRKLKKPYKCLLNITKFCGMGYHTV